MNVIRGLWYLMIGWNCFKTKLKINASIESSIKIINYKGKPIYIFRFILKYLKISLRRYLLVDKYREQNKRQYNSMHYNLHYFEHLF